MPNQDGTGPFGDGRRGRGMGLCNPQNKTRGIGFAMGGRRRHQGFGRMAWRGNAVMTETDAVFSYDKDSLVKEKSRIERLLTWINDRLAEIDR